MLLSVDGPDSKESVDLSYSIITAIADAEGVDPTDIEPPAYESLYDVLNPEALDSLFQPRRNGTPRSEGCVEFSYCGYDVVVWSDGRVEVEG